MREGSESHDPTGPDQPDTGISADQGADDRADRHGGIPPGEPAAQCALAAETGLNPNTIQKAYQELESEGVIYTVGGKGCFVGGEENAAEATCRRAEAELREALRQARLAGVEKTTAEALVERCYGGNE